jgi:FKBP-type peptidyl-prolyl cis-trans isomerase 2
MKKANSGDVVKIYYIGQTENGDVFDTSMGKPVSFKIGNNEVVEGLDKGVIGMGIGEKKTLTIPPEQGFGERREQLVETVKKSRFPEHIKPEVGKKLQIKQGDGSKLDLRITEIKNEMVTLDANHPLSGQTLNFEIEMVDIE